MSVSKSSDSNDSETIVARSSSGDSGSSTIDPGCRDYKSLDTKNFIYERKTLDADTLQLKAACLGDINELVSNYLMSFGQTMKYVIKARTK
jgi:hypothetical protein